MKNICIKTPLNPKSRYAGPNMVEVIQMFFMGIFLKVLNIVGKYKKEVGIGIYSIILTHTLIWIETGPTDIMIWFLYLLGFIVIVLNYKNIKFKQKLI